MWHNVIYFIKGWYSAKGLEWVNTDYLFCLYSFLIEKSESLTDFFDFLEECTSGYVEIDSETSVQVLKAYKPSAGKTMYRLVELLKE